MRTTPAMPSTQPQQQLGGRGGGNFGAASGTQPEAARLRVRTGDRQAGAAGGSAQAQANLGLDFARRQDRGLRAQSQPLHDGRRKLRQGGEERQRHFHQGDAALYRRRGRLRLRRTRRGRRRSAAATGTAAEREPAGAGRPGPGQHPPARVGGQHRVVARFEEVRAGAPRFAQDPQAVGDQRAGQSAADARNLQLRHARRGQHAAIPAGDFRRGIEGQTAGQGGRVQGPDHPDRGGPSAGAPARAREDRTAVAHGRAATRSTSPA